MTPTKTIERSRRGDVTSPQVCGAAHRHLDDEPSAESVSTVEEAWLVKSTMEWVRDDRGPLKAFRWQAWDRYGVGHPPSRVVKKTHA
jgi:hypothetical protein